MHKELTLVIFHRVYFVTFIEGLCPNGAYARFLKANKSFVVSVFLFNENRKRTVIKLIDLF